VAPGVHVATSLSGGAVSRKEVLDLAALGRIKSLVDRYPLSKVTQGYEDMEHPSSATGRAARSSRPTPCWKR
jgi:D-arabinose 1-dehydrogenase-like Zn-dependent alcohol dehydrogenase